MAVKVVALERGSETSALGSGLLEFWIASPAALPNHGTSPDASPKTPEPKAQSLTPNPFVTMFCRT